jgi:hypothetical protein
MGRTNDQASYSRITTEIRKTTSIMKNHTTKFQLKEYVYFLYLNQIWCCQVDEVRTKEKNDKIEEMYIFHPYPNNAVEYYSDQLYKKKDELVASLLVTPVKNGVNV